MCAHAHVLSDQHAKFNIATTSFPFRISKFVYYMTIACACKLVCMRWCVLSDQHARYNIATTNIATTCIPYKMFVQMYALYLNRT